MSRRASAQHPVDREARDELCEGVHGRSASLWPAHAPGCKRRVRGGARLRGARVRWSGTIAAVRRAAAVLCLLAVVLLAAPGPPRRAAARRGDRAAPSRPSSSRASGSTVRWTDGDTFRILSGPHRGRGARLVGVNALETFGPVHRIGALTAARRPSSRSRSRARRSPPRRRDAARPRGGRTATVACSSSCPDAAEALVRAGHAMVFAVDAPRRRGARRAAARGAARARRDVGGRRAPARPDEPPLRGRAGPRARAGRTTGSPTRAPGRDRGAPPRADATGRCEEVCVGDGAGARLPDLRARSRGATGTGPPACADRGASRRADPRPARGGPAGRARRAARTGASGSSLRNAVPRNSATTFPSPSVTRTLQTEVRRDSDSSRASAVRTPLRRGRARR